MTSRAERESRHPASRYPDRVDISGATPRAQAPGTDDAAREKLATERAAPDAAATDALRVAGSLDDPVPGSAQPDTPVRPEVTDAVAPPVAAVGTAHLVRYLAVYTLLRLALVVALTALLAFFMPLIVALLFAIIVQLPLAWLLFGGPRAKVNDAIAEATAKRRAERARLQSALSGEPDQPT